MQAGYLADNDRTREVIAWQETDSYRRLAFTLDYWSSALEEMLSADEQDLRWMMGGK